MRVPRVGGICTPRVKKINTGLHQKKLTDPPVPSRGDNSKISFRESTDYYYKKYMTLPPEIRRELSPKDAVNMFKHMDYIARGVAKGELVGQGPESKVYVNPWVSKSYFIILSNPDAADLKTETIYSSKQHLGDAIWCDRDDHRFQILSS